MTVQSDTEVSQRSAVGRWELTIATKRRHGVTTFSIKINPVGLSQLQKSPHCSGLTMRR
jgi:hypothetical protein